jgi:hypothetical protein
MEPTSSPEIGFSIPEIGLRAGVDWELDVLRHPLATVPVRLGSLGLGLERVA